MRSSQPLVGIRGQRSEKDEKLLAEVVYLSDSAELVIVDARPSANAVGKCNYWWR